jgi:hypothetical protein
MEIKMTVLVQSHVSLTMAEAVRDGSFVFSRSGKMLLFERKPFLLFKSPRAAKMPNVAPSATATKRVATSPTRKHLLHRACLLVKGHLRSSEGDVSETGPMRISQLSALFAMLMAGTSSILNEMMQFENKIRQVSSIPNNHDKDA